MKIKALLTALALAALALSTAPAPASAQSSDPAAALSPAESKLYELIMQYRERYGLPRIPLSGSLTYVAQVHARDLQENYDGYGASCNMHSWSGNGAWTPCCYTSNHARAACMWDKPRELTSYKGNGYEIAAQAGSVRQVEYLASGERRVREFEKSLEAAEALDSWKGSPAHNAVIINEGIFSKNFVQRWGAVGIGMYRRFAVVWFGMEADVAGAAAKEPTPAARQNIPATQDVPAAKARDGSFTDPRDGKAYRVVEIGGKTWMGENLNYKAGQSWCYDYKKSNCKKYGRLYDWATAKAACPTGWHLPSSGEWDGLMAAVGGVKKLKETGSGAAFSYHEGAGKKLKSKGGWDLCDSDGDCVDNGNGTDDFGFSALPGGLRDYDDDGSFNNAGNYGFWWSATAGKERGEAYQWLIGYDGDGVGEFVGGVRDWFSVRCVEN